MRNELLDLYTDYLITSTSQTSATGLSSLSEETISHDEITRMLGKIEVSSGHLWKITKPLVREVSSEDGVIAIDDCIVEKPHSDESEIVCWHWDHSAHRSVKGIGLLSLVYHSQEATLPLSIQILAKTEAYHDQQSGQIKRRSPVSKNEYAQQMLVWANRLQVPYRYVLADSWYASNANITFIAKRLRRSFIFAIQSNRHVAVSETAKRQGIYCNLSELLKADGDCVPVFLKGTTVALVAARHDFKNGDGSTGTLFLISNDLSLDATAMLDVYKKRWNIELYHKSLKQNASIAASPARRRQTQSAHLFAAIVAFVKLESLKIRTNINHFALKKRIYLQALLAAHEELRRLKPLYVEMHSSA